MSFVPKVRITTNIGCSNMCKCCPQSLLLAVYPKGAPKMLSFENFKTCIDKLPKGFEIDFSGFSEPFLNPRCGDMVLYTIQKKHIVAVYSTLIGFTEIDAIKLKDCNFKRFMVHEPDPIYWPYDYKKWLNTYSLLRKYGIKHQKMCLDNYEILSRGGILKDSGYLFGSITCSVTSYKKFDNNILLPNGDLQICCQDYNLKHKIGNLLTGTLETLSREKIIASSYLEDSDLICRKCERAINAEKAVKHKKIWILN